MRADVGSSGGGDRIELVERLTGCVTCTQAHNPSVQKQPVPPLHLLTCELRLYVGGGHCMNGFCSSHDQSAEDPGVLFCP